MKLLPLTPIKKGYTFGAARMRGLLSRKPLTKPNGTFIQKGVLLMR